jgi:CRISPR-associated Csx11 family protein
LIVSKPHSQGLKLAETLKEDAPLFQDQKQVESWWQRSADICSVCGLRPQGPSNKSLQRKVCYVCEQRREDRSIEWAKNLNTTIWIDEVADINSRLALVVGQLAIDDWLKPDGMIKTLLVKPLTAGSTAATKNVSFARLQRVWETTRLFWEDVASSMDKQVGKVSPRLRIEAEYRSSSQESDTLGVSHSYEIKVENQRLSLVCVKEGEFLTAENLHYLAKLLNAREEDQKDYGTAAMFVRDTLLRKGEFEIEEPTGYGSPNKLRGKLKLNKVTPEATPYVPAITILAEPRNFMALVPADKALNVVEAIKAKYEIEMGKVRNRLPLTVGVVFAGSRTPLAALLDAGRRMLKFRAGEKKWKVTNARDDSFKTGIDDAGNEIRTASRRLNLQSDDAIPKKLAWHVPNKMGDGTTPDDWYPYFFTDAALDATRRMFQSPDGSRRLIHVGDLKNDGTDEVIVQPSTFDFEFLNSAAQRFEINYNKDGKRRGWERRARPYYLEEIEDFQKLWEMLAEGLATSQIKTLGELIETKRREWRDSEAQISADVFEQFVKDAINNAAWKKGKRPKGDDFTSIVQAAVRGQLADVIELYTQILKQKSKVDGKDTL